MDWCPQHAMNAYLETLHLCKMFGIEGSNYGGGRPSGKSSRLDEPKTMEFLSALAAGNGAKLIVQVTSGGVTPVTLALAVAAKQTGGRFVCIVPHRHDHEDDEDKEINVSNNINRSRSSSSYVNFLRQVEEFMVVAENPCEIIKQQKEIDFLVVDSKYGDDDELRLLMKAADVNPKGSVIVFTNLLKGRRRESSSVDHSFGEIIVKKKYRSVVDYESVTLPVGDGIELTKIVPCFGKYASDGRKSSRFHVTYEY